MSLETTAALSDVSSQTHASTWSLQRSVGPIAAALSTGAPDAISQQVSKPSSSELSSPTEETKKDYYVRQLLRQSAFATILLATDTAMNRNVVIKVSNIRAMQQVGAVMENPILEASLLRRLPRHRNLIELYAEHFTSNNHWMVLEHAEGGDLFDFADRYAPFPDAFVRRIICELGAALAHLHRYGVCHLDVSMENVLLDAKLSVKLSDLGVARFLPKGGALFAGFPDLKPGKSRYMAPELLEGQAFDGRLVDSFALGVILYSLLTGSAPFNDCSEHDKRWSIIMSGGVRALLVATDTDLNNMICDSVVDLLDHLLTPAARRWTVDQALMHPWVNQVK